MDYKASAQAKYHTILNAQRHRHWCLFAFGALLIVALSGCQDVAQSHPATIQLPVREQTPTDPSTSGSRKYRDCIAAADNDAATRGRCLDQELAYQRQALDGLYQERMAGLDVAQRVALEAEQRAWQQETDRLCDTTNAPSVAQACRLDRTIARFELLNYHSSDITPAHWATGIPDANGALELHLGDAVIAMQSDGCTDQGGILICNNTRLRISTPVLSRKTLSLPEIRFQKTGSSPPSSPTGYRGSLHEGFVNGWYSLMLSDINADGHEDLLVWSGSDGSYGDPSYTYYLYDTKTRQLLKNTALEKLVEGHSLSRIVDGRLFVWYRSGPCERGEKIIEIHGSAPKLVGHKDYTTCK